MQFAKASSIVFSVSFVFLILTPARARRATRFNIYVPVWRSLKGAHKRRSGQLLIVITPMLRHFGGVSIASDKALGPLHEFADCPDLWMLYFHEIALPLFRALDAARTSGVFEREKPAAQFGEQSRRQEAIGDGAIVAIADAAQIEAGPVEQIAFGEDHP